MKKTLRLVLAVALLSPVATVAANAAPLGTNPPPRPPSMTLAVASSILTFFGF